MIKGELDSPPIPPDHPLLSELRQKQTTKPRSERGFTFVAELGRHATPHGLTPAVGVASSDLALRRGGGPEPDDPAPLVTKQNPRNAAGVQHGIERERRPMLSRPVYYQDCELYQVSTSLRT